MLGYVPLKFSTKTNVSEGLCKIVKEDIKSSNVDPVVYLLFSFYYITHAISCKIYISHCKLLMLN